MSSAVDECGRNTIAVLIPEFSYEGIAPCLCSYRAGKGHELEIGVGSPRNGRRAKLVAVLNDDVAGAGAGLLKAPDAARRYLALLKRCLTRELFLDEEVIDCLWWPESVALPPPKEAWAALDKCGLRIVRPVGDPDLRKQGADWPVHAETMVGPARLDNVEELVARVIAEGIPGDLVETGVWRGGTIILMRAVLAAYGDEERTVWACDSFEGLPEPDVDMYPADAELLISNDVVAGMAGSALAVSAERVRENLARYELLDDRVRFVEGWFRDTLPSAPIEQIAVLRLDGDLYESTMDALVSLESKVSPGGFVIVDDYNGIDACKQAVTEYRAEHDITDPINEIDWVGVWWQKSAR